MPKYPLPVVKIVPGSSVNTDISFFIGREIFSTREF
jgi:hypothetical protein